MFYPGLVGTLMFLWVCIRIADQMSSSDFVNID